MSTETQTATAAGVWTIDNVHSRLQYEIKHNGTTNYVGTFDDLDARIDYSGDDVKIYGKVDLTSVDLKDEQQRGHVFSPDFFDVERYPTAEYESSAVRFEDGEVVVDGNLTLRGETKPVTLRGTISEPTANIGGSETIHVSLAGEINRQDYGVSWSLDLPNGKAVLGDDVKVTLALELVQSDSEQG